MVSVVQTTRGLRLTADLTGLAEHPGELIGWGSLHADLALRRRPRPDWVADWCRSSPESSARCGLTREELARLVTTPAPLWQGVIQELAHRLARAGRGAPNGDPRD